MVLWESTANWAALNTQLIKCEAGFRDSFKALKIRVVLCSEEGESLGKRTKNLKSGIDLTQPRPGI